MRWHPDGELVLLVPTRSMGLVENSVAGQETSASEPRQRLDLITGAGQIV